MTSIAERLARDPDQRLLVEILLQQHVIRGNKPIAKEIASICTIMEVPQGNILIRQDDADNDIYFILNGRFRILVNEREVATRELGQHVGEMALIDPSSLRTATVVSCGDSIVAKITEPQLASIANSHPDLWRNLKLIGTAPILS